MEIDYKEKYNIEDRIYAVKEGKKILKESIWWGQAPLVIATLSGAPCTLDSKAMAVDKK